MILEASYESALPDNVPSTFLDVAPDHLKFSFAGTHRGTLIDVPGAGEPPPRPPVSNVAQVATRSVSL